LLVSRNIRVWITRCDVADGYDQNDDGKIASELSGRMSAELDNMCVLPSGYTPPRCGRLHADERRVIAASEVSSAQCQFDF